MRKVTCSMSVSLDGYIVGPDGRFDWSVPDAEVFRLAMDEARGLDVHLLGRRLYETMVYWEDADEKPELDDQEREFAAIWNALPKVVFSTTLQGAQVRGNARLASGGPAEEIRRLRAEPGEGDIGIGGATLAAEAAAHGLIDEYRIRVYPVLVGGGTPFFPRDERRADLALAETRTFDSGSSTSAIRCGVRACPADQAAGGERCLVLSPPLSGGPPEVSGPSGRLRAGGAGRGGPRRCGRCAGRCCAVPGGG